MELPLLLLLFSTDSTGMVAVSFGVGGNTQETRGMENLPDRRLLCASH